MTEIVRFHTQTNSYEIPFAMLVVTIQYNAYIRVYMIPYLNLINT
jgi:hypothetical protein